MTLVIPNELPEKWVWANLEDIADIIMGSSPPSSAYNIEKIGLPFFQGKADFGSFSPTPRMWCSSPQKVAEKGDVLISVRAPVGPTNFCKEKSCIGRGLGAVRPKNGIPSLFVLFYLRLIAKDIAQLGTGSTFTAIRKFDLESLQFPLAPLNEMKRIVAKVEALQAESKIAHEALGKVFTLLRGFRPSILAKALAGKLTDQNSDDESADVFLNRLKGEYQQKILIKNEKCNVRIKVKNFQKHDLPNVPFFMNLPKGWIWVQVNDLLADARYGTSQKSFAEAKGSPVLRIPNVVNGSLDLDNLKYAELSVQELKRLSVNFGDILVVRTNGSLPLVGKTARIDKQLLGFVFASYLIRLRPLSVDTLPEYLTLVMSSHLGRNVIEEKARTTAGQHNVNLSALGSIPVPLPPYNEMRDIVRKVKEALSLCDSIESKSRKASKRIEEVNQAVLAKAFRGELVPQDTNDEPASVLLQRIRSSDSVTFVS